ncbi:MAG: CPBP family intramembrane metalloprotease [Verrucomicrobia bacterium]|nr:CPBP family intramembrane metalloprotease [Verrucomicrobiota bacterium]
MLIVLNPGMVWPMDTPIHKQIPLSFLEAIGLSVLFLTVGVWGAAVTTMALMALVQHIGGAFSAYLMETGADRVMRRCLMGWAALFIIVLLKRAGWRGWRDCGFSIRDPEVSAYPVWGYVLVGISLGLITMGGLSLMTLLLDLRVVTPVAMVSEGIRRAISFIGSGIAVAVIEETVCRGMLFRVLARNWSKWPAALLTSALFALAHFLSPDPQSFHGASFFQSSINVYISTYTVTDLTPANLRTFVNLTLLGILFSGFVVRTRTIWLSIGLHAAWVWGIKFFHLWTAAAPNVAPTLWLGQRSDFMDSLAVTGMMVVLIAWAFSRPRRVGSVMRHQDLCWRVLPAERESLLGWLNQYYDNGGLKKGVVLKDHDGSRVMAQAGRVLKFYELKQGWAGVRFAIRPSRARRAFLLGRDLRALGIPTPRPMAWMVSRRFGLLQAEALIIVEAIGAEPLTDWLLRNAGDPSVRAGVMAAYGRLTAMVHQAGYSNRDMKHDNVMCSISNPVILQVIDLDGMRHLYWISRRRAGRDLMRVGKSLASLGWSGEADVRAFFDAYNAGVPPRLRRHVFPL